MPVFAAGDLRRLGSDLFVAVGAPREEAELVADHMVESGLLGHDSHGVLRYPQYVDSVRSGKVIPGAPFEILSEAPRIAHVSGNWNFGPVTAHRAAQLAVEKARGGAVAAVTVRRCNHVARLGRFAAQIAASGDLVGMLFCNGHGSDHSTAPFGGAGRRLPTNPLAVAVPTGGDWPILLDMTTSMTSGGAMRIYRNLGEPVPDGFIIDAEGAPTTDVEKYYGGGALLPLGFPGTGHKGFGLAVAVDILAGALSGAGCSRRDPPEAGNALLIAALNVAAFVPVAGFLEEVGEFAARVKSSPPTEGFDEVVLPGEKSHRVRGQRLRDGMPVDESAWEQIRAVAGELGVALPEPLRVDTPGACASGSA